MRHFGVVASAILMAALIVSAGIAAAVIQTRYITSIVATEGTVTGGLTALSAVDGNVLNITESGGTIISTPRTFRPFGDANPVNSWGKSASCTYFYECIYDASPDYNTTIIWPRADHVSIGFKDLDTIGGVPTGSVPLDVFMWQFARKNTSVDPAESINLYLPDTHTQCGLTYNVIFAGTAWEYAETPAVTDCGGVPWTWLSVYHLQMNITVGLGLTNPMAITTMALGVHYMTPAFLATVYLNATVGQFDTPRYVNWTCNRTIGTDWNIYAWNQFASIWDSLTGDACNTGAQTSFSVTLASGSHYVAGSSFSSKVVATPSLAAGSSDWDRFVLVVNYSSTEVPQNLTGDGWSWLLFLAIVIGAGIFLAVVVRRWEDSR